MAILMVVFHHLPGYTFNFYDLRYFGIPIDLSHVGHLIGYFGLAMFIFMSGYLINAKKLYFSTWDEIKVFAKQKLIRIYPLYYVALPCFLLVENVRNPIKILIHMLGLQLILRTETDSIPIQTLWFVGLITLYYAIFSVVKNSSLGVNLRVGILIFSCLLPFVLNRYFGLTDYRIALYYWTFWFGVLCSENNLPQLKIWQPLSLVSAVIFVAMFINPAIKFEALVGLESPFLLKYLLFNVLTLSSAISIYNACDWLSQRFHVESGLKFIAFTAYCTYLFHRPMLFVMRSFLVNQLSIEDEYLILTLLVLFGIPLVFALSYGLQRLYESYLKQHLLSAFNVT